MLNKMRGSIKSVAVKAPGFGDRRKAQMADIAIPDRWQVITEEVGLSLDAATLDMLGSARKGRCDQGQRPPSSRYRRRSKAIEVACSDSRRDR